VSAADLARRFDDNKVAEIQLAKEGKRRGRIPSIDDADTLCDWAQQ
jgi:hypothetical protein